MKIEERFYFSGHAIGVAAHFHRIDDTHDLDHRIPTLGSSAIPSVGGHSRHRVANFAYTAGHPRHITLVSAQKAETMARGKCLPNQQFETEIYAKVHSLWLVEKLHVDLVEMHQSSTRGARGTKSQISTSGCRIEGLRLGGVSVKFEPNEEPFATCGTTEALRAYCGKSNNGLTMADGVAQVQEINGRFFGSLFRGVSVAGPEKELQKIHVDGYSIRWEGFGTIYLGEVIVSEDNRTITMLRLKMGSDAGGSGSVGDGHTNSGWLP